MKQKLRNWELNMALILQLVNSTYIYIYIWKNKSFTIGCMNLCSRYDNPCFGELFNVSLSEINGNSDLGDAFACISQTNSHLQRRKPIRKKLISIVYCNSCKRHVSIVMYQSNSYSPIHDSDICKWTWLKLNIHNCNI